MEWQLARRPRPRRVRGWGRSGLHRAGCWVTPRPGDRRTVPQKANRPIGPWGSRPG